MAHDDPFGTAFPNRGSGDNLEPLASQVISLLRERQTAGPTGARQVVVDYLVRAITAPKGFDVMQVMDELRGYRLTVDAIIDLYIPQAADCIGELWQTSDLDFASVTVGALRLQSLLGEASSETTHLTHADSDALHALVVVPEGEQHFLGASVVAAQLRRLGCDVSLSISERTQFITNRVICDQPDMVLMSCARGSALDSIAKTVKKIKKAADPMPVLALGGAVRGDRDGMKDKTGVDLVTNTAKDVVSFCMKRHKALSRG